MLGHADQLPSRVPDPGGSRQDDQRGQRVHCREGQAGLPEQAQQEQAAATVLLVPGGDHL